MDADRKLPVSGDIEQLRQLLGLAGVALPESSSEEQVRTEVERLLATRARPDEQAVEQRTVLLDLAARTEAGLLHRDDGTLLWEYVEGDLALDIDAWVPTHALGWRDGLGAPWRRARLVLAELDGDGDGLLWGCADALRASPTAELVCGLAAVTVVTVDLARRHAGGQPLGCEIVALEGDEAARCLSRMRSVFSELRAAEPLGPAHERESRRNTARWRRPSNRRARIRA